MFPRRRPSEEYLLTLYMLLVGMGSLTVAVALGFFTDIAAGQATVTPTPTPTVIATASATASPSLTPTPTVTLTVTPTQTQMPTPSDTPTAATPVPPTRTRVPATDTPTLSVPTATPQRPKEPGVSITCTSSLSTGTAPEGQQKGMMSAFANQPINCTVTVTGYYESVAWASLTNNGSELSFTTSLPSRSTHYSTSMRLQVNWGGNPVIKYMDVQVLPAY